MVNATELEPETIRLNVLCLPSAIFPRAGQPANASRAGSNADIGGYAADRLLSYEYTA